MGGCCLHELHLRCPQTDSKSFVVYDWIGSLVLQAKEPEVRKSAIHFRYHLLSFISTNNKLITD